MADNEIGGGRVEITLEGQKMELVPTLEACIEISSSAGGINGAVQRLTTMHFETMCMIVGVGLRPQGKALNPRQRDDMVPKAIFEAGLVDVAPKCIEFCRLIANGGRPLEDEEEVEEEGDDAPLDLAT